MIEFEFNQAGSWKWLLLLLVLLLLVVQCRFLFFKTGDKKPLARKILNLLLWVLILVFVMDPVFYTTRAARNAVLAAKGISGEEVRSVADSLKAEVMKSAAGLDAIAYDTVFLLGQNFDAYRDLSRLKCRAVKWIPKFRNDQLKSIRWNGVVIKGQNQRITGAVYSSSDHYLKLMYGGKTLDSLLLRSGENSFTLSFPVFAEGRVWTELFLGTEKLADIRFFAGVSSPLSYQFVLEHPDFETTTLANWLGRKGNSVTVVSKLSKNVVNEKIINIGGEADVVVTEPGSLDNPLVRQAVRNRKSIVVMGMTQPEPEINRLNRVLNADLKVRKIVGSEEIEVDGELRALPFRFSDSGRSFGLDGLPVGVSGGRPAVAVTLLKETYPLMLSGDSLAYERLWNKILVEVQPPEKSRIALDAPLFSGLSETVGWYPEVKSSRFLRLRTPSFVDTLFFDVSPLNSGKSQALFIPVVPGAWYGVEADPAAEFYVEEDDGYLKEVAQSRVVTRFVGAYDLDYRGSVFDEKELLRVTHKLPGLAWILVFLFVFAALWLEPKLSNSGSDAKK